MLEDDSSPPLFTDDEQLEDYTDAYTTTESQDKPEIRAKWSKHIGVILLANTFATLSLILLAMIFDYCLAIAEKSISSDMRIVSANVILAMIGATLVQVGSFAIIIARWGFKRSPPE